MALADESGLDIEVNACDNVNEALQKAIVKAGAYTDKILICGSLSLYKEFVSIRGSE